jgi:hypothetical protein
MPTLPANTDKEVIMTTNSLRVSRPWAGFARCVVICALFIGGCETARTAAPGVQPIPPGIEDPECPQLEQNVANLATAILQPEEGEEVTDEQFCEFADASQAAIDAGCYTFEDEDRKQADVYRIRIDHGCGVDSNAAGSEDPECAQLEQDVADLANAILAADEGATDEQYCEFADASQAALDADCFTFEDEDGTQANIDKIRADHGCE